MHQSPDFRFPDRSAKFFRRFFHDFCLKKTNYIDVSIYNLGRYVASVVRKIMAKLPIIVASGGINTAGRTSHRHAHHRLVFDSLDQAKRDETARALTAMMDAQDVDEVLGGTLVRKIERGYFDPSAIPTNHRFRVDDVHGVVNLAPDGFATSRATDALRGLSSGDTIYVASEREFEVSVAGQLPSGFDPGALYTSRNHPRGLQMSIYAMSDALADLGLDWDQLTADLPPDAVSVYVSSSMGQLDEAATGGMLTAALRGERVLAKNCPLGFAEMPGDFLNAYVLKSLGQTGPALGACATFLYNLQRGVDDIRSGRARIAVVGASEAPILPSLMDGYVAMGALATDKELRALQGIDAEGPFDHRSACRPFGDNCGFVMAESAQILVLMDDELALEQGAPVLGAVPFVSVHADGAKKSIPGPGPGNYLTMARAAQAARDIVGDTVFRSQGLVMAHGTGTPQNRTTESAIMSTVAKAMGVSDWRISAIKSHTGHSLGAAGGDQLSALLGVWDSGWIPGIGTIEHVAEDVETDRLSFLLENAPTNQCAYSLVNSKGFGGNNATATVMSPAVSHSLLKGLHGERALDAWQSRFETTQQRRQDIEASRLSGDWQPLYRFNDGVLDESDIEAGVGTLKLGVVEISTNNRLMPSDWLLET